MQVKHVQVRIRCRDRQRVDELHAGANLQRSSAASSRVAWVTDWERTHPMGGEHKMGGARSSPARQPARQLGELHQPVVAERIAGADRATADPAIEPADAGRLQGRYGSERRSRRRLSPRRSTMQACVTPSPPPRSHSRLLPHNLTGGSYLGSILGILPGDPTKLLSHPTPSVASHPFHTPGSYMPQIPRNCSRILPSVALHPFYDPGSKPVPRYSPMQRQVGGI